MLNIVDFIKRFSLAFPAYTGTPWDIPPTIDTLLREKIKSLPPEYRIKGEAAIHKSARIEEHTILKGTMIIGPGCFIGAHAYIRGGVFMDDGAVVGPGCEVKTTMIFKQSVLAHFNFVGDSIIGQGVNMEAGSVIANHFNERVDKTIHVLIKGTKTPLSIEKFGALIGDQCRIGANAVLSPGTILEPGSVVKRLELVEQ
jgi:NDP-sugar pyrophosphorylase family protein